MKMCNRIAAVLCFAFIALANSSFAQPWTVNLNTATGTYSDCFHAKPSWQTYPVGTLEWALDQANSYTGPVANKRIIFNLPAGAGSQIDLASWNAAICIPNLVIDGTLPSGGNVTFINGDQIMNLTGTGMTLKNINFRPKTANPTYDGVRVTGNSNTLDGIVVEGFFNGVVIAGNSNTITGITSRNNGNHGLFIFGSTNTVANSSFSNNAYSGVSIRGDQGGAATGNIITGNSSFGNTFNGFAAEKGANGNTFQSNYAYSNLSAGIVIDASNNNKICGNTLGLNKSNAVAPNAVGVSIGGNSSGNLVGSLDGTTCNGNTISGNTGSGVEVNGTGAVNNTIVRNSISCNGGEGISLINSGNGNYGSGSTYIELGDSRAGFISGQAPANSRVDIYGVDPTCDLANGGCGTSNINNPRQGKVWVGTVTASSTGYWEFALVAPATKTGSAVTATSPGGATSEVGFCQTTCVTGTLTLGVTASPAAVCIPASSTVTVANSQVGYTYVVVRTGTTTPVLAGPSTGNGGNLAFTIPSSSINAGSNSFSVLVRCTTPSTSTFSELNQKAVIQGNSSPNAGTSVTATSPVCSGSTSTVTIATQNGVSYQLQTSGGTNIGSAITGNGSNMTITIPTGNLPVGSNQFQVVASIAGCTNVTLTARPTVVVDVNPVLTYGITSNSPVCLGNSATVTIANSQTGVSYQARIGSTNVGTAVAGSTGNTVVLTIPATALTPAGSYTIEVYASNTGCGSIKMTNTVTVVVNPAPSAAVAVTATSPICAGSTSTVTIATQTGVSYQLQTSGGTNIGSPITGNGSNMTITIPVGNLASGTSNQFQVIASVGGCTNVTLTAKPTVVVDVNPVLTYGITSNSPVCLGNSATVTIANSQTGVSYQARIGSTNVGTAVAGSTGNTVVLTVPASALTPAGSYTVDVYASNTGCGSIKMTNSVTVVVNPAPSAAVAVTATSPICAGSTSTVTIATQTGVSYQLQTSGGTNIGSPITGNGSNMTITIPVGNLASGTSNQFQVIASVGGCSNVTLTAKPTVVVDVNPDLTYAVTSNSPICLGNTATVTIASSQSGVSYQASIGGTLVGSAVAGTGSSIQITVPVSAFATAGTYTVDVFASNNGCGSKKMNNSVQVIVNAGPKNNLAVTANPSTVCEGSGSVIQVASSETGVSYQLQTSSNANVGSAQTGNGSALTFTVPTGSLTPGSVAGIDYTFKVQASIAGCVTPITLTQTAPIKVKKAPNNGLDITSATDVCSSDPNNIPVTIKNSEAGVIYQAVVGGSSVGNPGTGTGGDLILTIPFNQLPAPPTAITVSVTAANAPCGTITLTKTLPININKGPETSLDVAGISPICRNADGTVNITGSESGVSYQAFIGSTSVGTPVTGNGALISLTIPANNLTAGTTNTISVRATIAGCNTATLTKTASILVNNPVNPSTDFSVDEAICKGETATVRIISPQASVTYAVFVNGISIGNANPSIVIPANDLTSVGDYIITVKGSIPGCAGTVDLTAQKTLKVKDTPNQFVPVSSPPICYSESNSDKGTITINGAEVGVTYTLFKQGGTALGTFPLNTGSTPNVSLDVLAPTLSVGPNGFSIRAKTDGACNAVDISGGTTLYVIKDNFDFQLASPVCRALPQEGRITRFAPGATEYVWSSLHGTVITDKPGNNSIKGDTVNLNYSAVPGNYTYDTLYVYARALPTADCDMHKKEYYIRIVDGVIFDAQEPTTVCRYAYGPDIKDSIFVDYSYKTTNATRYRWSVVNPSAGTKIHYDTTYADSSHIILAIAPVDRSVNIIPVQFSLQAYSECIGSYVQVPTFKNDTILPIPDVNAGRDIDTTFAIYQPILLTGTRTTVAKPYTTSQGQDSKGNSVYQYFWRPLDNGASLTTPDKIQTYLKSDVLENNVELKVWNRGQCAVTDTVNVKVKLLVTIPNAFTPNNDNMNDYWEIRNLEYFPNNSVVIYNQWGSKVYEANPYQNNWNGTHNGEELPIGTYYYVFDIKQAGFSPSAGSITIVK